MTCGTDWGILLPLAFLVLSIIIVPGWLLIRDHLRTDERMEASRQMLLAHIKTLEEQPR